MAAARRRGGRSAVDRNRFSGRPRAGARDGRGERSSRAGTRGMMRRRWVLTLSAAAGVALLAWTVWSVGARELAAQLNAVAPTLPLLLVLAGGRFFCQAAGWRLAMSSAQRPEWGEVWTAVVAGEAAGYFAWGPLSREPM